MKITDYQAGYPVPNIKKNLNNIIVEFFNPPAQSGMASYQSTKPYVSPCKPDQSVQ